MVLEKVKATKFITGDYTNSYRKRLLNSAIDVATGLSYRT